MQAIREFFSLAPYLAWSAVSVLSAMLVIALNWPKVRWWWMNTWYSFPLVGKIARLSKDPNRDPIDPAWFKAEKTLCRDYKQFIRIQDENDFHEKIDYLTKAGDIGRKSTPPMIWVLTAGLVLVEAMGFSYVLAGYTLPGASENLQQTGALGIAFLLSVLLVAFTHYSGRELYVSGKIMQARQEWVEGGRVGKTMTGEVPLAKPQSVDNSEPTYVQLMNRVGKKTKYIATILTVIFVLIVAIFATYVRGQVLEKQLQQQITGQLGESQTNTTAKPASDSLNMSGTSAGKLVLPAADAAANRNADQKAKEDEVNIDRHGGWGTFIVLAFIFVFLQILGVIFGYQWGFAGKESFAAFVAIGAGRYASYADVREHYTQIADAAQSKLENLQQRLMEHNSISGNDGLHTSKTFYDFMEAEHDRETLTRQKEINRTAGRQRMETELPVAKSDPPVAPSVASAASMESARKDALFISEILQQLQSMADDKEKKKAFINNLPEHQRTETLLALKAQKEEQERKANQRDAELDDLL